MTSILIGPNPVSLSLVADADALKESGIPLAVLTRRMREGSDEGWREFHRCYYLQLLRYASLRTAFPDDANDIVQQVYLRVARHIKPFHDETEFWRWLACVVRCAAVDHQRGIRRRTVLLEKFAHWQAAQRAANFGPPETATANSLVLEALTKLPFEDAYILRLKYYEGCSVQQIALQIDTTPKAIENRLGRLRKRLREVILRMQ